MKRIVSKGVICPHCSTGIRLTRLGAYITCLCRMTALMGDPEDPVVICNGDKKVEVMDNIIPVDDNYKRPKVCGGLIVVNKKAGGVFGVSQDVLDKVMPLLAAGKTLGWTEKQLREACKALLAYDKLIGGCV